MLAPLFYFFRNPNPNTFKLKQIEDARNNAVAIFIKKYELFFLTANFTSDSPGDFDFYRTGIILSQNRPPQNVSEINKDLLVMMTPFIPESPNDSNSCTAKYINYVHGAEIILEWWKGITPVVVKYLIKHIDQLRVSAIGQELSKMAMPNDLRALIYSYALQRTEKDSVRQDSIIYRS